MQDFRHSLISAKAPNLERISQWFALCPIVIPISVLYELENLDLLLQPRTSSSACFSASALSASACSNSRKRSSFSLWRAILSKSSSVLSSRYLMKYPSRYFMSLKILTSFYNLARPRPPAFRPRQARALTHARGHPSHSGRRSSQSQAQSYHLWQVDSQL